MCFSHAFLQFLPLGAEGRRTRNQDLPLHMRLSGPSIPEGKSLQGKVFSHTERTSGGHLKKKCKHNQHLNCLVFCACGCYVCLYCDGGHLFGGQRSNSGVIPQELLNLSPVYFFCGQQCLEFFRELKANQNFHEMSLHHTAVNLYHLI